MSLLRLAQVGYIGLILLLLAKTWLYPIADASPWVVAGGRTLILLVGLYGVLRGQAYTLMLMCFVVLMFYFTSAVVQWVTQALPLVWPCSQVALSSLFFIASLLYVRQQGQQRKQAALSSE